MDAPKTQQGRKTTTRKTEGIRQLQTKPQRQRQELFRPGEGAFQLGKKSLRSRPHSPLKKCGIL